MGCVVRGYVSGAEDVQVQVGAAVCAEIGTAVKPRHRRSKLAARARVKKKKKRRPQLVHVNKWVSRSKGILSNVGVL